MGTRSASRARSRPRGAPAEDVKILIVDDHAENRLALSAVLEAPDRTLVEAASGRDALRAILHTTFAVILLDVNMPEMDGFETAALIRQRPASAFTPIIFITAHRDEAHVVRAYSLGAVDYILSPANPDVLRAKVSVFVELFRKTVENRRQADRLRRAEAQLRRQAEERLRQADERLRLLIESVRDYAIFSLDRLGRVATWNAGSERLFLYPAEEVIGQDPAMLLAPEAREGGTSDRQFSQAVAEGRGEIDAWFERKDGSRFYGNDLITAIRSPDGNVLAYSKVTRNITDRKYAQEALQQKAEALAEANRVKDEFLAVLSHELRTPLNAIIGWAHMLLNDELNPRMTRQALEAIARNGRVQLALINDILDVSRFITGKLRLALDEVDVRTVVEAAVETSRALARSKRVSLDTTIPPRPALVIGDSSRLQQVVWNLLSNAIKFTPEGGTVTVVLAVDRDSVLLEVKDSGIGIPPDFLPFVFDRFRQADSSTARLHGGLGLGLAIVKHVVEMHSGTVQADSEGPGRGATFTVRLPAHAAQDSELGSGVGPSLQIPAADDRAAPGPPDAQPVFDGLRCLVVDDDADTRELVRMILEGCGARVVVAVSAAEAIPHVPNADVLVADLGMPGEDGYALMRRIRELPAAEGGRIPAIALTAFATESDRVRALEAGFHRHITKPIEPGGLLNAIDELARATAAEP